jgi:hypothetical protein
VNLFETNKFLAVKLNQSLDALYSLPFYEYSIYLTITNKQISESNARIEAELDSGLPNFGGRLS